MHRGGCRVLGWGPGEVILKGHALMQVAELEMNHFRDALHGYDSNNIFNMDESGLFQSHP